MHGEDPFSAVWSDKSMRPPPPSQILQERRRAQHEAALEANAPEWIRRSTAAPPHASSPPNGEPSSAAEVAALSTGMPERPGEEEPAEASLVSLLEIAKRNPWPTIRVTPGESTLVVVEEEEEAGEASTEAAGEDTTGVGGETAPPTGRRDEDDEDVVGPPTGLVWFTRLGLAAAAVAWVIKARARL